MLPDQEERERMRRELNDRGREITEQVYGPLGVEPPGFHFDREGKPIGMGDHAVLKLDDNYKRVASDYVGYVWVSTVWIGHNLAIMDGPPLIFETMAFDESKGEGCRLGDDFMRRYLHGGGGAGWPCGGRRRSPRRA
jgi:hypothetical protein